MSQSQGILARIANSAEYSIAVALLAVCLVVGGAFWFLRPQQAATGEDGVSARPATAAAQAVDERAAIEDWNKKLGEQFSAIDEQQRKRGAEEDARKARQRAEEAAAAEARRQADLAAQARQQAEAKAREQAAASRAAPVAPVVASARRAPVLVDAAIDWSSCRRPSYPSLSVDRGEEGVVTIAVDLDAAAKIQGARVAQTSGFARLDRATLEAVKKCRFMPAREDGVAKAAIAQVRFNWKLQQ